MPDPDEDDVMPNELPADETDEVADDESVEEPMEEPSDAPEEVETDDTAEVDVPSEE